MQGIKSTCNCRLAFTTAQLLLQGTILVNDTELIQRKELAIFEREGDFISLESTSKIIVLILNGEPIDEPIVGQCPFVMNSQEEIDQAIADYRAGRF
jgi:quercetin 2,3-dioxygenase